MMDRAMHDSFRCNRRKHKSIRSLYNLLLLLRKAHNPAKPQRSLQRLCVSRRPREQWATAWIPRQMRSVVLQELKQLVAADLASIFPKELFDATTTAQPSRNGPGVQRNLKANAMCWHVAIRVGNSMDSELDASSRTPKAEAASGSRPCKHIPRNCSNATTTAQPPEMAQESSET